ncbi:PREDICTED: pancreatic prohormone [Chinchilla lanigera]|uniref:pancreatic prohormone n=1 Tax=Chinchilla lanigera TaxID=34839 RepID=UPI00069886A1|nr:PREDICTED: pancreatic prohormone [Chinchilla lanigera]
MAAARRCLSLLLLGTCVALLLPGARGAPLEPVYPGDNATPEQMAQYAAEMRRYINMLTRPRWAQGPWLSAILPLPSPGPQGSPRAAGRMAPTCKWAQHPPGASSLRYGKSAEEDALGSASTPGGFHHHLSARLLAAKARTGLPGSPPRTQGGPHRQAHPLPAGS